MYEWQQTMPCVRHPRRRRRRWCCAFPSPLATVVLFVVVALRRFDLQFRWTRTVTRSTTATSTGGSTSEAGRGSTYTYEYDGSATRRNASIDDASIDGDGGFPGGTRRGGASRGRTSWRRWGRSARPGPGLRLRLRLRLARPSICMYLRNQVDRWIPM